MILLLSIFQVLNTESIKKLSQYFSFQLTTCLAKDYRKCGEEVLKITQYWNVGVWFLASPDIFLRVPKELIDKCFEKGGSQSIHLTKFVFMWIFNEALSSSLQAAAWHLLTSEFQVNANTKQKRLYCQSSPPKCESSSSLHDTILAKPKSWSWQPGWDEACHKAITGTHPHTRQQEVLLLDPAGSLEQQSTHTLIIWMRIDFYHQVCLCKMSPGYSFVPRVLD